MSETTRTRFMTRCEAFASTAVVLSVVLLAQIASASDALSDPTRPAIAATVTAETHLGDQHAPLDLSAIFFAEGRRIAIINDRRVRQSDVIQSARIVAIDRDRVKLVRGAETIELHLLPSDIKRLRSTATPDPIARDEPEEPSPRSILEGEPH